MRKSCNVLPTFSPYQLKLIMMFEVFIHVYMFVTTSGLSFGYKNTPKASRASNLVLLLSSGDFIYLCSLCLKYLRYTNSQHLTMNVALYSPFSPSIASAATVVNRSSVAALAFVIWDIFITLDDEIALIWLQPWTFAKFHYFFIRYVPAIIQIPLLLVGSELSPHFHFSPHACYVWQIYQGVAAFLVDVSVGWILILRVDALYHHNPVIHSLVRISYVCSVVGMLVGLVLALLGVTFDRLCIVVEVPRTVIIFGASSMAFELSLFFLTLYKFIQAIRRGCGDTPPVKINDAGCGMGILLTCLMLLQPNVFISIPFQKLCWAILRVAVVGLLILWLSYSFEP